MKHVLTFICALSLLLGACAGQPGGDASTSTSRAKTAKGVEREMLTLSVPEFLRARDSFQVGQVVQVHGYFQEFHPCFWPIDVPVPECLSHATIVEEWPPQVTPEGQILTPVVYFEGPPSARPYVTLAGLLDVEGGPVDERRVQYGREYLLELEVILDKRMNEQGIPGFRYRSHKPLRSLQKEGPIEFDIYHFLLAVADGLPDKFQLRGVVAQMETCEGSEQKECVRSFSLHHGPLPEGVPFDRLRQLFTFTDAPCSLTSRYLRGFWGKQSPPEEFEVGAEVVLDLTRVEASACPAKLDRAPESFEYLGHHLSRGSETLLGRNGPRLAVR